MSTTIVETKQFADLAALPWRFDVFNGTDIQVMDANGRLVFAETFESFHKRGEEYLVAFEAWQQTKVRWQFIVHASQLFPQMFSSIT